MGNGFGRGGMQGLIVAMLFFGPLLAAMLLYGPGNFRPGGSAAHGTLLEPTPTVPEVGIRAGGAELPADWLQGSWTLLYFTPGHCDDGCRTELDQITSIWTLLAKDRDRVRRVLLAGSLDSRPDGYIVARLEQGHPLTAFFRDQGGADEPLFIVDPLGNAVIRYASGTEPKGVLEDMKRLLKLSRIG